MQPLVLLALGIVIGGVGGYALATARNASPPPAVPKTVHRPSLPDDGASSPSERPSPAPTPQPADTPQPPARPAPAPTPAEPVAADPAPAVAPGEAQLVVTLIGPDVPRLPKSLHIVARRERIEGDATYVSERRLAVRGARATGACEPGRQTILASLGSGFRKRIVASTDVDTVAGPSEHVLAIPKLHAATIIATPGRLITLMPAEDDDVIDEAACDDSGQCSFEWLAPGRYRLSDQVGVMTIEVPTVGPVTFVPRPLNAVRIDVHDANGKLAQAGFVDGDVIVGVAGRRFQSAQEFGALLSTGRPAIVVVERRGRELSLTLQAGLIQTGDPGGAFRPVAH